MQKAGFAPSGDEGLVGLKAAQSIVTYQGAGNLRGGDSDAEITQLLVPLYKILSDQKSLDALKQTIG